MNTNKENTFTEQNRFLVYSDQLNATQRKILDTAEEMISCSAIQTFEDEGETVTATGASYLAGLTVDGKAVQDGTPTPDNPVPVEVVEPADGVFGISVNGVVTSINLQGNVLASLPNGTKDVLRVDSAGHCVLTKNVGKTTVGGSATFGTSFTDSSTMGGNCTRITMYTTNFPNMKSGALNATNSYMSIAVAGSTAASAKPYPGVYSKTSTSNVYLTLPSTLTSAADATAWLTANNFDFFYPLAEATTIDCGYITMPAIPDGAEISITAQVTPTIAAKWWTKNQSDVAAAFGAVSSDLAALQGEISALDARVTALEGANAKTLVLEKLETSKEVESEDAEADEQEEMNPDDAE